MTDKPPPTLKELKNAREIHLTSTQHKVWVALAYLFQKNGVFPSGFAVVDHTGLSEYQVDKAITVLKAKGLIKPNRH